MVTAVSLVISGLALSVAVYGIFERQRAEYAGLRVRLTQLVSSIEELNVDEGRYRDEHAGPEDVPQSASAAFQGQRALLTYQALDLLEALSRLWRRPFVAPPGLTANEYGSIAYSLEVLNDLGSSERLWRAAVRAAENGSGRVLAANCRGLAHTLFTLGNRDEARSLYQRAADTEATMPGDTRWGTLWTYVEWLRTEMENDGQPEVPARQARQLVEGEGDQAMAMALQRAATRTVFVDGQYIEETVGLG